MGIVVAEGGDWAAAPSSREPWAELHNAIAQFHRLRTPTRNCDSLKAICRPALADSTLQGLHTQTIRYQ